MPVWATAQQELWEGTALFVPDVPGHYSDVAAQRGLFTASLSSVTFGVLFCDVDLDGYRDLVTTNGHIEPGELHTEYPAKLWEYSDQLAGRSMLVRKARVIPIECFHIASVGIDLMLGALAYGASQVAILSTEKVAQSYAAALVQAQPELRFARVV